MRDQYHQVLPKGPFDNLSNQQEQRLASCRCIQEIIVKIQQTISEVSLKINKRLEKFQQQQLLSYKKDLLNTHTDYLKLKAERSQETIKKKVSQQKRKIEEKLTNQIKKSVEINENYEKIKKLMKKYNSEEKQLIVQIKSLQKYLEKQNNRANLLDAEIQDLINKQSSKQNEISGQSDSDTQLVSDFSSENENKQKDSKRTFNQPMTNSFQHKINFCSQTQQLLKSKISLLKDYVQNKSLNLNFMEEKFSEAIKKKENRSNGDKINKKQKSQKEKQFARKQKTIEGKKQQNRDFKLIQSNRDEFEKEKKEQLNSQNKKEFKLPNLNKIYKKTSNYVDSVKPLQLIPANQKDTLDKDSGADSSNAKQKYLCQRFQNELLKQQIALSNQLGKQTSVIEQIFSDRQVKQYLYRLLFSSNLL